NGWREATWAEMEAHVLEIAAALVDDGVCVGDRVAILSATRPEWVEIDLAILACGALTIPIYQSSLPAECGYIIANSESSVVVVENAKQRAKIDEVTARGFELDGVRQTVSLRRIITIDDAAGEGSVRPLVERGRAAPARLRPEAQRRVAAARPHLVPAVPRIYEKVYARMLAGREAASPLKRALFDWAIAVGRARSRCEQERRPVPIVTSLQNAIAHRLVFARIHQLLGGNIRYMTSGAAPLAREILEFFHAVGILVLEGDGLTEP